MSRHLALALVLLPFGGIASAADVELASRIDRVTVFPDAAQVTRVAAVDLAAGPSTLVLRGLPATLDPGSLRVEGKGSAAFAIGSVDSRVTPGDAKPVVDPALEGRIEALRREREDLDARHATAEARRAMIERYAQASPEKLSAESKPLEIGQWAAAWEAVGTGLAAVHRDLRDLRRRIADVDTEIAALERARPRPPRPGAPKRDVIVAVEAGAPLKGEVTVTYRVAGASWTASYDARLDSGGKGREPSLDFTRRAEVSQRTGEDWTDVVLSVSTARVARNASPPDLPPVIAQFYEPPRPVPMTRRSAGETAEAPNQRLSAPMPAAAPPMEAAKDLEAHVEAGAFQATFTAPGRVDVAQDGAMKSFVLAKRSLQPTLEVKAAPVIDETAYLEASFMQQDQAPLLPGQVSLHRDGTFVGRSRIGLIAPGDRVDLGFGVDDLVKIERAPLRRRESEPGWIGNAKTDLVEFKTTVRNLHATPMRITIVDRVPVSENSAITVETLRETTPPTKPQVDDKRGVMAWSYDYAAGDAKDIRLSYRIRWPADRDLALQPRPLR
jgi:uncharacterized protein (TIGR02231 family)